MRLNVLRGRLKSREGSRESALGRLARRTRGSIPAAGCDRACNAARRPNALSARPPHQPPLFPSATSARRVASLLAMAGVARLAEIAADIGAALAPCPTPKSTQRDPFLLFRHPLRP